MLAPHFSSLVTFTLETATNRGIEGSIRCMALNFLLFTIECKKTRIIKQGLVGGIVQGMFAIATSETDEGDEETPSRVSYQVLSMLALATPPSLTFPFIGQNITRYAQSSEASARAACMIVISVISDGCTDYLRPRMSDMLVLIQNGLKDTNAHVRKSACLALSSLCDVMSDTITPHHSSLIPLLYSLIDNTITRSYAVNALDALIEDLGHQVTLYLPHLLNTLLPLLESNDPQLIGVAVGCVGSIAHAAPFSQYFTTVINLLHPLLNSQDDLVKDITIDAIASIAESVGAETFAPYLHPLMALVQNAFPFYGSMARVFKDDFNPFLEPVVQKALDSISAHEPTEFNLDEWSDDESDGKAYGSNAIADEKGMAAECLGQLFSSSRTAFLPFVDATVKALVGLTEHYFEGVRKSAVNALFVYLHTFYALSAPVEWVPGVASPLHENVSGMLALVFDSCFELVQDEYDM